MKVEDEPALEPHSFLTNGSSQNFCDLHASNSSLTPSKQSSAEPLVDTNQLSDILNVPKPVANQDLMLLPDFKLAALPITDKMLPSRYSLVRHQAFGTLHELLGAPPVLETFQF